MKPIPKSFIAITCEQDKAQIIIDNFFEEIKQEVSEKFPNKPNDLETLSGSIGKKMID